MAGFKYDKLKSEATGTDGWGSYSDLFMVLSFIFLMMYVVAQLRSGTGAIQQHLEKQQMVRENADLRAQMKAYDTLKDQALKEESKDEQEVYSELMDKLSLLQEEQREERNKLRAKALENEKKEVALNKYQQIIRNIINANTLAKSKLKVREEIIDRKNDKIDNLEDEIEEKKQDIAQNNLQIKKINSELAKNIANLEKAQKTSKITRQKAIVEINRLKEKSQAQVAKLNQENLQVQRQLSKINEELQDKSQKLAQSETVNQELSTELQTTTAKLEDTVSDYNQQIAKLQNAHAAKMAKEKAEFQAKLRNADMTAKEKAKQLEAFNAAAKAKDAAINRQIASLESEIKDAEAEAQAKGQENAKLASDLAGAKENLQKTVGDYQNKIKGMQEANAKELASERAAFEGKLKAANLGAAEKAKQLAEFNAAAKEKAEAMGREISGLKGDLATAQARADARAKLSRDIASALKSAGVDADVNPNTGDVTISFGQDYFDSGSALLKPTMAGVLKKFVPKYSESLFKDPKIAEKITSVDIIGFASPTYQGRYVDPKSLSSEDQKAAKYNLDLSYQRARAIFDYMFDTKKINYQNQQDLLGLVKVTGRSFFNEGRQPAGVTPGMSHKEFCSKFDCKKAQKVIIKFNMDDKK